jgi:hypothetical protein
MKSFTVRQMLILFRGQVHCAENSDVEAAEDIGHCCVGIWFYMLLSGYNQGTLRQEAQNRARRIQ